MRRTMMHGKIHRATVTDGNVEYVGSITIDKNLIDLAGILEYEKVQVADVDNGARLETYVIAGEAGSGDVIMNGAAARLISKGDRVIIIAYGEFEDSEARSLIPKVVIVDEANKPVEARVPAGASSG